MSTCMGSSKAMYRSDRVGLEGIGIGRRLTLAATYSRSARRSARESEPREVKPGASGIMSSEYCKKLEEPRETGESSLHSQPP